MPRVSAFRCWELSPSKANRLFCKERRVRTVNTEDKDSLLFIERALDVRKNPCGISAVESTFSPLKLIQTAAWASTGYKKLCKRFYIHCNYPYFFCLSLT